MEAPEISDAPATPTAAAAPAVGAPTPSAPAAAGDAVASGRAVQAQRGPAAGSVPAGVYGVLAGVNLAMAAGFLLAPGLVGLWGRRKQLQAAARLQSCAARRWLHSLACKGPSAPLRAKSSASHALPAPAPSSPRPQAARLMFRKGAVLPLDPQVPEMLLLTGAGWLVATGALAALVLAAGGRWGRMHPSGAGAALACRRGAGVQ